LVDRDDGEARRGEARSDAGRGAAAGASELDRVNLGILDSYIGFHLRLAQAASFRAFKRHSGLRNLRPGWFAVLSIIGDNPGITPVTLSRASGRDKSTITPILRELVRERMIRRESVPNDRRSYALSLTPRGAEALAHLAVCAAEHDRELDAIAGDQKPALLALLRRFEAELE
jgi:DNA-binding MarR family transcriptional regulator